MNCSDPGRARSLSLIADASWSVIVRASAIARYPAAASRRAIPRPSPRLAPVTRTLRMVARQLAALRNRKARHERDRDRDLVLRQAVTAEPEDLLLYLRLA